MGAGVRVDRSPLKSHEEGKRRKRKHPTVKKGENMIREAIEKIEEMAAIQQFEIDGRKYTSKGLIPVLDPAPVVLTIETLTGFCDYIKENIDRLNFPDMHLVHVQNYRMVFLISSLSPSFRKREIYIKAETESILFPYGQFMDLESFIVRIQSMFVQDENTTGILKIVGNVSDGMVKNFQDDGVTQQATVKTGVSRVAEVPVPNPVDLTPYRTFLEIEQPKSKFVFRMRSKAESPECALFEADGGAWKNVAKERVRDWLKDRVGGIPIIA
jgi:hypothetical protein